ncbi:MAG: helix-turn-helix domain-containing protein [Planctomycetota bacterium]
MLSDQLRAAIEASEETYYRIAKDAEVDWGTLQRFVDGRRPNIRIDTVDKLCEQLGLELRPKKGRTGRRSR